MLAIETECDPMQVLEPFPELESATLIQRAVRMAAAAANLPAIATQDWCESAAKVLAGLDPGAAAGVLLGQVTDQGEVRGFEAAGVGCNSNIAPYSATQGTLPELRWRLESMTTLGWKAGSVGEGGGVSGGRLSQLMPVNWRESPSGAVWSSFLPSEVFVGTVAVAGELRDRRLAAWVALRSDARVIPGLSDVFLAILKQIGESASRAIGQQKPGRSIWITPKEQEVLDRLTLGYSVREIAAELGRSPHTMHDHVKSLHRKLGASSRGDLIARALGHQRMPVSAERRAMPSAFELTEIRPKATIATPTAYRAEA